MPSQVHPQTDTEVIPVILLILVSTFKSLVLKHTWDSDCVSLKAS